jgi:hypothetical protein
MLDRLGDRPSQNANKESRASLQIEECLLKIYKEERGLID